MRTEHGLKSVINGKSCTFEMRWAILYHFYNLKSVKKNHGGVLLFTKNNTSPWVFFTFFKLYKWYQIAQRTTFTQIYGCNKNAVKEFRTKTE